MTREKVMKATSIFTICHPEKNEEFILLPLRVIPNEVKNPFSSHARTVEMKEP
jgi:hypothetical protein